jgi:hypothetical protein
MKLRPSTKTLPLAAILFLWASAVNAEGWRWDLTPYIWATSLNGTQTVQGKPVDVDASFSDILDFIDYGLAARLEGRTDGWGFFGDIFHAKLSEETAFPATNITGEMRQTIIEGAVTFPFADDLEVYLGLRNQDVDFSLDVSAGNKRNSNNNWTDGMVGFIWKPIDTGRWTYWLRADAGAGDSDAVWLAATGVGYRFSETVSLALAYRHLDTEYENEGFGYDIVQSGLGLGLGFSW